MMSENERCPRSGVRPTHMCELKQQGMMDEIDRHSRRPTVVCTKCGARSNEAAYLCNPRPL